MWAPGVLGPRLRNEGTKLKTYYALGGVGHFSSSITPLKQESLSLPTDEETEALRGLGNGPGGVGVPLGP